MLRHSLERRKIERTSKPKRLENDCASIRSFRAKPTWEAFYCAEPITRNLFLLQMKIFIEQQGNLRNWVFGEYSFCIAWMLVRWHSGFIITSTEREVKDSRLSVMYQSWYFQDKIGHAKSVGFRFYSAIWQSESRISSRCLEITSISLIYSLTLLFWLLQKNVLSLLSVT